jgi:hypothetical protein
MKKKLLAVLMTGMMIGTMAACGGAAEVTEEPPIAVEQEKEEDDEPVVPEPDDITENTENVDADVVDADIPQGVWIYSHNHSSWVVIEGDNWECLNENGEVLSEGKVIAHDGVLDLNDYTDAPFFTFEMMDDGSLIDDLYMVEYYPVDHLPEKFPAQLEAEIGFDEIVGDWTYQEQDTINYEDYNDMAFVRIFDDGRYTIRYNGEEDDHYGMIIIELDENPDGSTIPMYSFFEGGNNYWNSCYMGYGEGEPIYFGNGGTARLVPAEGVG